MPQVVYPCTPGQPHMLQGRLFLYPWAGHPCSRAGRTRTPGRQHTPQGRQP